MLRQAGRVTRVASDVRSTCLAPSDDLLFDLGDLGKAL